MTSETNGMAIGFCFDLFLFIKLMAGSTFLVLVLVMRKVNCKLRDVVSRKLAGVRNVTKTRKQKARRISRRHLHVTIGTDPGSWSLTREELLSVAIQTRCMFGKFGDVRKRRIAFADLLPVVGGKLVTRVTPEFLFGHMS